MFRPLISAITEDDNPRLHRIPFLLLWILSFGIAWSVLYIYEMLWYNMNFDLFLSWLKQVSWREGIFVGLLFGLTLSFVQTWLIRQRYGYVPKFWRAAIILGGMLAGLGYPHTGLRTFESFIGYNWMGVNNTTPIDSLINDFLIWFIVFGLSQTIVMFRVNRKAWLMMIVGLFAAIIASIPLTNSRMFYSKPMWALIMGTAIQAIGTGILFLYLMANPREGNVMQ